jgi:NAD(P)H dehydrogenase (quinone)
MKNVAVQSLAQAGHEIVVTDLYGQGFSAVAQKWDFVTTTGNHYNYALEQKHAANLNMAFSPDILGEIQKIQKADVILFVTPIWWFSVPAILKGWFDRVLAMGVAWNSDKIYENGMLRGKQAMLIAAAGDPMDYYQPNGRHGVTIAQSLDHINHGTLAYCGLNVHEPFIAMDLFKANDATRDETLKELTFKMDNFLASPSWLVYYS